MTRRVLIAGTVAVAAVLLWLAATAPAAPTFAEVRARWRPSDAQLLDRHGDPLDEIRVDSHGRRLAWTRLDDISPALIEAVIAAEDRRFFSHRGVDVLALAVAAARCAIGGRMRGASTLTMQVAAMLDPSLERRNGANPLVRKLRQIMAALAHERRWSKREILEAYLNFVTWRGELQGIGAASRVMFGIAPHGIDRAEALVLAALVRAPNAQREIVERRALALRSGVEPPPQATAVSAATAQALSAGGAGFERIQLATHLANRMLHACDCAVRTTLDGDLQRFATATLQRHVAEVRERNVFDGAVLVVENATGGVWAYVGGTGELSSAPFVDGVTALRQPGSALKPFLYALAFERRILTPASAIEDTPLEVAEPRGVYRPLDYDRHFRGLVSARTALASSLNVPAVRTIELVGVDSFTDHLRSLGFSDIVEQGDYYGGALALGSADVTLWQLVSAYRALANRGLWSPLLLKAGGTRDVRRVYDPAAAFLLSDILADRASRSATFGLENSLATRFWSAAKTGTSKDMRDNWCIGYTDRFTVGVWVGNFSGSPMRDVTGITGAAPVWLDIMNYLHERYGGGAPVMPAGLATAMVKFPRAAEPPRREWFIAGTEPYSARELLARADMRIVTPSADAIIAIDPDIPRDDQRVAFTVGPGTNRSARWMLDGRDLGPAQSAALWPPRRGTHRLVLRDASGRALDAISFQVRGETSELQN